LALLDGTINRTRFATNAMTAGLACARQNRRQRTEVEGRNRSRRRSRGAVDERNGTCMRRVPAHDGMAKHPH
jgi:hypothetical protein